MVIVPNRHWAFEDETDPIKGKKGDTDFLKENYKFSAIGSIFRTPKARFTPKQIRAGATKAGFNVQITEEGPWNKVLVIGKLSGVGKAPAVVVRKSKERDTDQPYGKIKCAPKPLTGSGIKNWRQFQKKVDIFS
jgi:hypothetical protein